MSYILDALKRAEADRDRGAIPGLHAQQLASYDDPDPQTSKTGLWLLAAAALVVVAGGAGYWWWRAPTQAPVAAAPKTPANAPAPDIPVVADAAPNAQPPLRAPSNAAAKPSPASKSLTGPPPVAAVQVPPQLASAKTPVIKAPVIPPAVPLAAPIATTPAPLPTPKLTPQALPLQAAANPGKGTAPGTGIPLLSELPDALRRQIPPLAIAGAVYSDDPSQRMLIINNQTFGQGNAVAPGVQLEEIQSSSSIFNFQGNRFQLDH
jgi:general secretion pathway protein B